MPPRFDDEACVLELSVADLLEREALGSIGFASRGGYERLWLGQAIHSRYQGAAEAGDATYRREIGVATELVYRGWQVLLRGRIDGLRRDADGTLVVEEIKSVRRAGALSPAARDVYRRQALLYAWMLHRERDEPVGAELVLIAIGRDEVEREPLEVDHAALEGEVRRRIAALLRAHEGERAAAEERRRVGAELIFPYPELRRGQERIVEAVEGALARRDHLLVEAPTGIGKTVAALYPALRHVLQEGGRLFVLTAKTLQQDMAMRVVSLLNDAGGFSGLRLRAKAKMCANGEVICHEEYCPYARDYYAKLKGSRLLSSLFATHPSLEPELVYEHGRGHEVCPFELSLDLSRQAQVVVCDYNYAFDPYVALSDFGPEGDLSRTVLVIDEVHNLVERGRGYYSPVLSAARARDVERLFTLASVGLRRDLGDLAGELARRIELAVDEALELLPPSDEREKAVETALPEDDLWALRPRFDAAFVDYLEFQREHRAFSAEDPFVDLYFSFLRFLDGLLLAEGDAFSTLAVASGEDRQLQVLCKDPSRFLGAVLERVHSAIGLSATLSPAAFYRDLLGLGSERTDAVSLPDPFPAENRRIVIDPTVETTWRQRASHYDRIAERLAGFASAVPGNCLALFPSYDFLARVGERLEPTGKRVLVQQRSDSDRARQEILDTLRGALFGDVLLLAVAGGVFAEGVDYPGDVLSAVAVVGPCLPAVSLERQLLKQYYQDRFERGFEYAFVVPGMTRVVQAAGRLLRSPEDRGVIALFDRRFLATPYASYLPSHWVPPEGPQALVAEPAEAAVRFFRG